MVFVVATSLLPLPVAKVRERTLCRCFRHYLCFLPWRRKEGLSGCGLCSAFLPPRALAGLVYDRKSSNTCHTSGSYDSAVHFCSRAATSSRGRSLEDSGKVMVASEGPYTSLACDVSSQSHSAPRRFVFCSLVVVGKVLVRLRFFWLLLTSVSRAQCSKGASGLDVILVCGLVSAGELLPSPLTGEVQNPQGFRKVAVKLSF